MPSWSWQDDARCRGESLVLFFGREGERTTERSRRERKAKAVCSSCSVRGMCLGYALSRPEKYGLWGGRNEEERVRDRRGHVAGGADAAKALLAAEPTPAVTESKYCPGCGQPQPLSSFSRDRTKPDGLNSWCRTCAKAARVRRQQQKAS